MDNLATVDFTKVKLEDGFWAPRMRTNAGVTVGIQYKHLVATERIDSVDPAYKPGDRNAHHIFWDSDIAKWIESAAYALALKRNPELEARIDDVVEKFARCQREDGYLNSWYNNVEPDKRWTNLRDCHELYCAGHLIEGAVAYYLATGKRKLLDIMCRYTDHIMATFGTEPGKRRGYCGHEEIELALVKLYGVTKDPRHLQLAKYFIDERGRSPHYFDIEAVERGDDPKKWYFKSYEYCQAHAPVREQEKVVGHAVRAMYLYCGMADVARETGDESFLQASERLWANVCAKQMYITGGIGPSRNNEGFTFDFDFPEETAYCETCAAIGLVFWNHRMLQLTGDSRYADVMERALYNGTISGISLSGDRFFYVNPLASLGGHHREEWFGCACCPGNISRLIASVGQYMYSCSPGTAWVHLYAQGSGQLRVDGTDITIRQTTRYPWDGKVSVELGVPGSAAGREFALALRIPGWARAADVKASVGGRPVDVGRCMSKGYLIIKRTWRDKDAVELDIPMPVETVHATPRARLQNGKLALQRGPIVYCVEECDNPFTPLSRIRLADTAEFRTRYEPDLLGGVTVVEFEAEVAELPDAQSPGGYTPIYSSGPIATSKRTIKAVPYCVWDNREPGQMLVWLPR